jgi:hypothetical protein
MSARKSPLGNFKVHALENIDALAASREVFMDVFDPDELVFE